MLIESHLIPPWETELLFEIYLFDLSGKKNTAVVADVSQRENITDSDIFLRKDIFPAERIMLITWKFTAVEYQPQDV